MSDASRLTVSAAWSTTRQGIMAASPWKPHVTPCSWHSLPPLGNSSCHPPA